MLTEAHQRLFGDHIEDCQHSMFEDAARVQILFGQRSVGDAMRSEALELFEV